MKNLKMLLAAYERMVQSIVLRVAQETEPAERRRLMDQYTKNSRMVKILEDEITLAEII